VDGQDAIATSIPEVREAINLAIDREELNDLVGGFGVPTLTRLTPPIPCWDQVSPALYDVNPFDPERARELLASVGYPDVPGAELTLHSAQGQGVAHRDIAETVAAMLEDVGFIVDLDIRDLTNFRETVYQNNPGGIMLQTLGNFTTDPWLFVLNYDSKFGTRAMPRNRFGDEQLDLQAVRSRTRWTRRAAASWWPPTPSACARSTPRSSCCTSPRASASAPTCRGPRRPTASS
jgi:peptide/nickel transport system substrate-binding protein